MTSKKIERRYLVIKLADIDRYLTISDRHHLNTMAGVIERKRKEDGRTPTTGLFVDKLFPVHDRVEAILLHWLNGGSGDDQQAHIDALEAQIAHLKQLLNEKDD